MAKKPLNALVLDDCEDDAILVVRELGRQGFEVESERAWTAPAMKSLLEAKAWDVVLSDYSMPGFDAPAALQLLQETGLDLPFIVISGTVGEEAAVAAMKNGAHDYFMKGRLKGLGVAVERELKDAGVRREHRLAIDKVQHLNRVLRAIRNVNQLIVTEKDRGRLLERATEMIVETRGYTSALCVHLDDNQQPDIVVAHSLAKGIDTGPSREAIRKDGLTACMKQALATNEVVVLESDAPQCSGCPLAFHYPNRRRLTTGLVHDGKAHGVLVVALPDGMSADGEELELLEEMSGDIAFALHGMEIDQLQKESDEKFRIITESSPDAIFIADERGNYVYVNREATRLLEYSKAELTGRSVADVSPPEQLDSNLAFFKDVLASGRGSAEIVLVRKDGTQVSVDLNTVVLPNSQVYGSCRDTTERKSMEAQVAQSDRLANMGLLAAGVAHEINNPLTYILYNLESLTDDLPKLASALRKCLRIVGERVGNEEWTSLMGKDQALLNLAMLDEVGQRFRDALEGSRRIKNITRSLSTFSRSDQERLVPASLVQMIEAAISMANNEIKYRARLVKDYGNTATFMAHDGKLSQVFLNLLINAAHAIPEGDVENNEIRIRTWQADDEVFAEFRDTGTGIAPEHLPRLFEPFFTTKSKGIGTGLGLSISQTIVETHGGHIEVHSEVGVGTTFEVRLPIRRVDEVEKAPVAEARAPAPVEAIPGRILVVDDEPAIRSLLQKMLSRDHEVVEADDGRQAKKILERDSKFDLVLCDLMMPDVSGIELHAWLVEKDPRLANQVVFMTGGVFTPRATEYLDSVLNVRVEKPFETASLRRLVSDLVKAARSEQQPRRP